MHLSDSYSPSEDVVAKEIGGEAVLMDLATGTYFGLNPVGSRIWQLLEERVRSLNDIRDIISAEYDAPLETVENDVLSLAASLEKNGLIVSAAA